MKRIMALALAVMLFVVSAAALAEAFTPITVEGDDYDDYLNNLDTCIESINDMELDTGETFSFNETVGERTEARGYRTAPNGRGVEVVGGGVAQVATTIYLAVKRMDDMEVVEKSTYGSDFCENYVAREQDAVLTDYQQAMDFRFVNRGENVRINLWRDGNNVYCSLSELGGATESEVSLPSEAADEASLASMPETVETGAIQLDEAEARLN